LILESIEDEIEQVVSFHTAGEDNKDWDLDEIWQTMHAMFPFKQVDELNKESLFKGDDDKHNLAKVRTTLITHILGIAKAEYTRLSKHVNEIESNEETNESGARIERLEKAVLLRSIDTLWVEHLEAMDYMRRSIGLRGYGQQDPLIEYKKEGFRLFNELINLINKQTATTIYKIASVQQFAPSIMQQKQVLTGALKEMSKGGGSPMLSEGATHTHKHKDTIPDKRKDDEGKKLGRNDPCFCGSGKKYKKCHGK